MSAVPLRILIVDDHPLMREGLCAVLSQHSDLEVVGEASDGSQAIEKHLALDPDITLLDLQMPGVGGLAAMAAIRMRSPQARLIVLTTYKGDAQVCQALKAGAAGYLLKSSVRGELIAAIRAVASGGRWVQGEVAAIVACHAGDELLSVRELDALRLVANGFSNREIGEQLSVSEDTVKARLKVILSKLGARDRTHAVTLALQRGMLPELTPTPRPMGR